MKSTQWLVAAPLGVLLAACCTLAQAQWVWVNDKGVKQFTDQPPPASVPPARILKAPRGQQPDLRKELAEQPADETQRPPVPAKPRPTLAERNADYAKRREEAAQQAQQNATSAQNQAEDAAACDATRSNQRMLESGIRVSTMDANGERVFLTEQQKAEQMRRNRDVLATRCK
ncbi:hypothetical protein IP92_01391 [Pseudoduganella flava]|uniref:DUF4124 domain-containing protein n=1 Tax=Pseudoduganella flava TaxID=871742 RepID=A0A562Q0E7_9BURK|nr:DUF4124 domain-containing protein [Pseudoduganella flava]QGZ38302.1 DUF4124 domain-containing protein [Pseudoduganella flava]TWI50162.1 hypothetical protein IP92_01391 [Pseudoduganella flava]